VNLHLYNISLTKYYSCDHTNMRWAEHVSDRGGAQRALVGRSDGRRALGRPSHRREDNIVMDLREIE
jgi:hypothetical protein